MRHSRHNAFSLVEILITLAILSLLALFTVPKLLDGGAQDRKFNGMANETLASISAAFETLRLNEGITTATTSRDLTPYLNYVKVDTAGSVDHIAGAGNLSCASNQCLQLHHGGILLPVWCAFGSTASTAAIYFHYDVDGEPAAAGKENGLVFYVYMDGRVESNATKRNNTYGCGSNHGGPYAAGDPVWFKRN